MIHHQCQVCHRIHYTPDFYRNLTTCPQCGSVALTSEPLMSETAAPNTTAQLEIERRYLIPLPLKWFGKFPVIMSPRVRIVQTYLKEHGVENSRLRAEIAPDFDNTKTKYSYTRKEYVSFGTQQEHTASILQAEYLRLIRLQDLSKKRIEKTRYFLTFRDQKFELDVFEGHLVGLSILEIELQDITTNVILPPYLRVKREITGEPFFSNQNLAGLNAFYD